MTYKNLVIVPNKVLEKCRLEGGLVSEYAIYDELGNRFRCNALSTHAHEEIERLEKLGMDAYIGPKVPLIINGKIYDIDTSDTVSIFIKQKIK